MNISTIQPETVLILRFTTCQVGCISETVKKVVLFPFSLLTSPQQDRKHCICTGFVRVSEDQKEDRKRDI